MSTSKASAEIGWIFQSNLPTERCDRPIAINEKEFILVPYHSRYWQTNGLYKYSIDKKKWSKFISFPDNIRTSFHTSAYDKKNHLLYIYNKEALLIIINLKTEQCVVKRVRSYGKYAASIVINSQFHLIGGFKSNKHLVWNNQEDAFREVFHFKEWGIGYYLHKLCYIASKQLLLTLGGYTTTSRSSRSTDHIYIYQVKKNKWHLSHMTMPRRMYSFAAVLSPNEKYLIILGGNSTNHIHILDLSKQSMVKLNNISCPTTGGFQACIMGNYKKDNLVVVGFVKRCWRLTEFKNVRKPSIDLIHLLKKWYSNEEIHIIQQHKKEHWKISVAEIVDAYIAQINN